MPPDNSSTATGFGAWTVTRSRLANVLKDDPAADVTDLRRQMKAERLAAYIRSTVDAMPPLTEDQRAKLAALFRSPGVAQGGGSDAAA